MPPKTPAASAAYATAPFATGKGAGITLTAYRGSGNALLAMDLDEGHLDGLAGFAIWRTSPGGATRPLINRLGFGSNYTKATTAKDRKYVPSEEAPFQKFRWTDFPSHPTSGLYSYRATAMKFDGKGRLKKGPTAQVGIELEPRSQGACRVGFTRGYLTSQAYAKNFQNAPVRPEPKTLDYDTTPYRQRYEWLGHDARRMLFGLLEEAGRDALATVDALVYDFDEPDVLQRLAALGPRLRILLDDSAEHAPHKPKPGKKPKADPLEVEARRRLAASAGKANVRTGHFGRFAHCKTFILRRNGKPVQVLTGSANFSVRGLYVQANNMLLFDDPEVAAVYAAAFEEAFRDAQGVTPFNRSPSAAKWHTFQGPARNVQVAFSPHRRDDVDDFLDPVAKAIQGTRKDGSVLFAVMELDGGGPVLAALDGLRAQSRVFSYGITQSFDESAPQKGGITVRKPDGSSGVLTEFAALDKHVPPPFDKEWRGGAGQVIHHKFVVCDFNGKDPVVFTGSSNLAGGGEAANGDNLLAIRDRSIATAFAVEAIRLFDHYHFRDAIQDASDARPLSLQGPKPDGDFWWEPYYDAKHVKKRDRELFANPAPLP